MNNEPIEPTLFDLGPLTLVPDRLSAPDQEVVFVQAHQRTRPVRPVTQEDVVASQLPSSRFGDTAADEDLPRFATATVRVAALLADGHWHQLDELRYVGGSSGDRRARDLRDKRWGSLPVDVEPDPDLGRGRWRYRVDRERCALEQLAVLARLCALAAQDNDGGDNAHPQHQRGVPAPD